MDLNVLRREDLAMLAQTNASCLSRVSGVAVALVIAFATTSTAAQLAGWRARQIDGSSQSSFEASVALLQNELPPRRREDFEAALAVIWISNTVDSADLDHDGDVDIDDIRVLKEDAADLLTDIQRGDLVTAVEEREQDGDEYTATDFLEQLDGLGYDEVLSLADRPSRELYLATMRRYRAVGLCGAQREQSVIRLKWCDRLSSGSGQVISAATGKVLNTAIEALNAQKYAEARTTIGRLSLDRLSPYERSKTEQILFSISYAEEKYAEAREHLVRAIDAGGLSEQEVVGVLGQIRLVDSRLAENPR